MPNHEKVQSKKLDTCNEFSTLDPPEMCAVLSLEGENVSYVRLKFFIQIKRRALIDTGSCANALPESLLHDLQMSHPSILTSSFHPDRMASGQRIPITKQANITLQIGPHSFRDSFLIFIDDEQCYVWEPFLQKT